MPSKEAIELATKFVTSSGKVAGTNEGTIKGDLVQFIAAQIDVLADLASKGVHLTPRYALIVLAQKGLSIANVVPNDAIKCGASTLGVGLGIAGLVVSVPTGPAGWRIAGLVVLSDLYALNGDCNIVTKTEFDKFCSDFSKTITKSKNQISKFYAKFISESGDWYYENFMK